MSRMDEYVAAMAALNDNPLNLPLLLRIQAYVDSLEHLIKEQAKQAEALRNAHKVQRISHLIPKAIEELEELEEQRILSTYEKF